MNNSIPMRKNSNCHGRSKSFHSEFIRTSPTLPPINAITINISKNISDRDKYGCIIYKGGGNGGHKNKLFKKVAIHKRIVRYFRKHKFLEINKCTMKEFRKGKKFCEYSHTVSNHYGITRYYKTHKGYITCY